MKFAKAFAGALIAVLGAAIGFANDGYTLVEILTTVSAGVSTFASVYFIPYVPANSTKTDGGVPLNT